MHEKNAYLNGIPPFSSPHFVVNSLFFPCIDKNLLGLVHNLSGVGRVPKQGLYGFQRVLVVDVVFTFWMRLEPQ